MVDGYSYDASARLRIDRFEGIHTNSLAASHQVCDHFIGYSFIEMSTALIDYHYPVVNGDGLVQKFIDSEDKATRVTNHREETRNRISSQIPRPIAWSLDKVTQ